MILRSLFLPCAALLAGFSSAAAAVAPGINPTGDSFVSSANAGNNYGAAGALEVSATGSAKGESDSFVRFNLASTKTYFDSVYGAGNWTVQSITLQLTTSAPNNAIFNNNAAGSFGVVLTASDAWVEGNGTPSAPDTAAGDVNFTNHTTYLSGSDQSLGMYSFTGGTSGASTYMLGLSSGFLSDVRTGTDASLYLSAADGQVSYLFNSTNFTSAAARPTLVVSAIPEPRAAILIGLFVIVFASGAALKRVPRRA